MMKLIIQFIVAIGLTILGKLLLQGDMVPFLQWWAVIFGLGLIFVPIATSLFANFHDKGYLFSKAIGIAVTGYIMWLLSSLHLCKFTANSCYITFGIGLVLNLCVLLFQRIKKADKKDLRKNIFSYGLLQNKIISAIITEELLFFGLFLLFTYIRCFKPEAYGTEKFMDYGFMTSMMRSEYMPPQDLWFSGTSINYYYVGQYIATFLTKLSFVKAAQGYNLMLMMLGAFTCLLPYSLVYNLTSHFMADHGKKGRILPGISGIIAGTGTCIASNMHYPVFKWLEPAVRKFFGIEGSAPGYWFPDATRYIGYHPETTDKTIHEFPAYSFVLGDLHAHVINILFVLTVLAILYAWMSNRMDTKETHKPVWKEIFNPSIIMIGFLVGLFHTTNFWDFPIYYIVSGAIILFTNMVVYNFKGKAFWLTALQGIIVIVFGELVCLPFTLSFDQISTNILLTVARTPLNQLIVLWGLPVFMVIVFLNELENHKIEDSEYTKKALPRFLYSLKSSDLFVITIGLCAIGLIVLPELVYVQDIYSGDYKRANTMFKLTYQAFILFGVCYGYILIRLLCFGETKRVRKVAALILLLFVTSVCYIQNAVNAWYGNIFDRKGYDGLDAAVFMKTQMPDDYLAINWLNENVTGEPVVLEANGDSYTDYQRVSVMTGLPTLLGWRTHEWLWKSNTAILDERAEDIKTIYSSYDEEEVRNLIDQYHISYIYVGKLEDEKFNINHELIKKLGTVVYQSPITEEKAFETYIVQIKAE